MAIYVTKRCPHCGHAYQVLKSGEQRKYGCPYKTCMKCGKSYWDKDIKEPALHGYENTYEDMQSIRTVITILIYGTMGVLLLGGGFYLVIGGELGGLFLVAMGGSITWIIGSHFKEKLDDMKRRDKIIAARQREYDESIARLKDSNYLTALATHDSRAKKVLYERMNRMEEHYAERPR